MLSSGVLTRAFQQLGLSTFKDEQLQIVAGILKQDVFVVLPTGFGKSACFQCLPAVFDQLCPTDAPSIVVVVAPLTAIIKDQVRVLYSWSHILLLLDSIRLHLY